MTARSFRFWQWETLAVTMVGYALYYVIRKNLSIAMPLLGEIGVSKVQLGAALAILAFWAVPASAPLAVKLLPFLFIGFFIYGPQALLGIATTQQATPRAAGVAGGFVGIFSYASTVLSGIGFGFVAQRWGWNAAYATICSAAVIGGLVLLAMWRADAYAERCETSVVRKRRESYSAKGFGVPTPICYTIGVQRNKGGSQ